MALVSLANVKNLHPNETQDLERIADADSDWELTREMQDNIIVTNYNRNHDVRSDVTGVKIARGLENSLQRME